MLGPNPKMNNNILKTADEELKSEVIKNLTL